MIKRLIEAVERIDSMMKEKNNKRILTHREAAVYMGISESYLYKLMSQRVVPYSKPYGKNVYFEREKLEAFLLSNPVPTAKAAIETRNP